MKKALVIDDDQEMRFTIEDALKLIGYQSTLAEDGSEALRLLQSNFAPEIILTDLSMQPMNGWEFLQEKSKNPIWNLIPIVVVSGEEKIKEISHCVFGTLSKPFLINDLFTLVDSATKR